MMWGNTVGCLGVVTLTAIKRRRYGWTRKSDRNSRANELAPTLR